MDKKQIVEENLALVRSIAKKFPKTRLSQFNDYVNVGVIAFLQCLETYDKSKGAITTYAYRPIHWAMIKEFNQAGRILPSINGKTLPVFPKEEISDYFPDSLFQKERLILEKYVEGFKTTEIAKILNMSRGSIYRILKEAKQKILEDINDKKENFVSE